MLLRRDAHEARLEMYTVLACLSKTCPKQASREPRFYHFPVTREAPTTDITTDQTRVRPRRCELAIYLIKCYEGILGLLLLPPITFKISLLLSGTRHFVSRHGYRYIECGRRRRDNATFSDIPQHLQLWVVRRRPREVWRPAFSRLR